MPSWIVHISDLHFWHKISGGGYIPKATGHESYALEALASFLEIFVAQHAEEDKTLLVTGDATALGDPDEFSVYRTALSLGFCVDAQRKLAPLGRGFERIVELPGNHDYWKGKLLNPFVSPSVRYRYFPQQATPVAIPLDQGHRLFLHVLCSTLGASRKEQVAAVGGFDAQEFLDLANAVPAQRRQLISSEHHFLATHHSPSHGSPRLQGLNQQAADDLKRISGDIVGVLTGHTHTTGFERRTQFPPEARSATSMQSSILPAKVKNGFLVHRFDIEGNQLEWLATEHALTGHRFRPTMDYKLSP